MSYLGVLVGVVLVGVAIFYWYKWYRNIKGDAQQWFSKPGKGNQDAQSLEAFVSAYRRGEVPANVTANISMPQPAAAPAAISAAPALRSVVPPPPAAPVARQNFLSGAPKLVYLLCRSALRDHHVFAHVPLRSLASPGLDPKVADMTIDLLVCNAQLAPVAAIDVTAGQAAPPDPAKVQVLRDLGIRYLRLSAKSLPRPDQLKSLLYRM